MMKSTQLELVLVPSCGIGHLQSAVVLAKRIIEHDHRISILVLILHLSLDSSMVNDFVDFHTRQNRYPDRLTFINLPPPANPTAPTFFHSISLHVPHVKRAVRKRIIQQAGSGSTRRRLGGFIVDMFCLAMTDVAAVFNVPCHVYFTSGANFLNLWLHLQSLVDGKGVDVITELSDDPNTEFYIPGFVSEAPAKVIPLEFLDNKEGVSTLLIEYARRFRKCKGILINTFTELEPLGVKALTIMTDANNVPEIYPVGPLMEFEYKRQSGCGTEEFEWLNNQPLCSVVFLCFGSHGRFMDDQVKEIANGLERSGYRFLWSLHEPASAVDALPEGFLERTLKRGKIIGWAPQLEILAHRAVGGFVSHCGWNSTIESLCFGVPMAAWPLYAEQQMNAFQLVEEMGIAVAIGAEDRRGTVVISAEEVENAVRKLMSLDDNMKNKVKEMRDKSRNALEEGGSSHKSLSRFVEDSFE